MNECVELNNTQSESQLTEIDTDTYETSGLATHEDQCQHQRYDGNV